MKKICMLVIALMTLLFASCEKKGAEPNHSQYVPPTTVEEAQAELFAWAELTSAISDYLLYVEDDPIEAAKVGMVLGEVAESIGVESETELPSDMKTLTEAIDKLRPVCEPHAKGYFEWYKMSTISDLDDLLEPEDGEEYRKIIRNAKNSIMKINWDDSLYVSQIFDLLKQINDIVEQTETAIDMMHARDTL